MSIETTNQNDYWAVSGNQRQLLNDAIASTLKDLGAEATHEQIIRCLGVFRLPSTQDEFERLLVNLEELRKLIEVAIREAGLWPNGHPDH